MQVTNISYHEIFIFHFEMLISMLNNFRNWKKEVDRNKKPNLLRAIMRTYAVPFMFVGMYGFTEVGTFTTVLKKKYLFRDICVLTKLVTFGFLNLYQTDMGHLKFCRHLLRNVDLLNIANEGYSVFLKFKSAWSSNKEEI